MVQISNFTLSTRRNGQIHNLKKQDASCRHFGFLGYVNLKKISVAPDWMKIYASNFYGIMHWTLAYTTACTVDHGLYGSESCSHSLNYSKLHVTPLIPNLVGSGCWATGAPQK